MCIKIRVVDGINMTVTDPGLLHPSPRVNRLLPLQSLAVAQLLLLRCRMLHRIVRGVTPVQGAGGVVVLAEVVGLVVVVVVVLAAVAEVGAGEAAGVEAVVVLAVAEEVVLVAEEDLAAEDNLFSLTSISR